MLFRDCIISIISYWKPECLFHYAQFPRDITSGDEDGCKVLIKRARGRRVEGYSAEFQETSKESDYVTVGRHSYKRTTNAKRD